jgi:hypothetical protein
MTGGELRILVLRESFRRQLAAGAGLAREGPVIGARQGNTRQPVANRRAARANLCR